MLELKSFQWRLKIIQLWVAASPQITDQNNIYYEPHGCKVPVVVLCALLILTAVALHFFIGTTQVLQRENWHQTGHRCNRIATSLCNKKTAKNFHPVIQVNKMVLFPKIGCENAALFLFIQTGFLPKTRKYSGEQGSHIMLQAADLEQES